MHPNNSESPHSTRLHPNYGDRTSIKQELDILKNSATLQYKMGIDCLLSRLSPNKLDPLSDQSSSLQESIYSGASSRHLTKKLDETPKSLKFPDIHQSPHDSLRVNQLDRLSESLKNEQLKSRLPKIETSLNLSSRRSPDLTNISNHKNKLYDSLSSRSLEDLSPESPISKKLQKTLITRAGFKRKLFGKSKKYIQSHIIIKPELKGQKGKFLFAISEGHGPHGSYLSEALKNDLVRMIESGIPLENPKSAVSALEILDTIILSYFKSCNLEVSFSACSLLALLVLDQKILIFNSGGCGGVIGKVMHKRVAIELCPRHTCNNEGEVRRIREKGGFLTISDKGVKSIMDGRGTNYELTRAIGYTIGEPIGVISTPDVFEIDVKNDEKIFIIGSKDVWELINYQEAVDLCVDGLIAQKTEMCCDALISKCESRLKGASRHVVDISVTVFFIN